MAAIKGLGGPIVGIGVACAYILVGKSALASCGSWMSVSAATYETSVTWFTGTPDGDVCETGDPNNPSTLSEVQWGVWITTDGETSNAGWYGWSYAEHNDSTGYWVDLQVDCNGSLEDTGVLGPFHTQHVGPSPNGVEIASLGSCSGSSSMSNAVAWVWTD
jgi:hypothetical protein